METICCGCQKKILNNKFINVFDNELNIYDEYCLSCEGDQNLKSLKNIKLYTGIELIIGHKISKLNLKSTNLCNECFNKVESYVNFRTQLINSLATTIFPQSTDSNIDSLNSEVSNSDIKNPESDNIQKTPIYKQETFIYENQSLEEFSDINISTSNELHQDIDKDIEESNWYSLEDEQNKVYNQDIIENSDDASNIDILENFTPKVQEKDIESDINVCSGEDDEILELDIQYQNNDTVLIDSSSESDIEICEYEPIGKRMKYCSNAVSAPALF